MSLSQIDLDEIARNKDIAVSITSNAEENPRDAGLRRAKDITLFVIALIFISATFLFCGYVIIDSNFSADDKKWASVLAGSIVSAMIGYLTGKSCG